MTCRTVNIRTVYNQGMEMANQDTNNSVTGIFSQALSNVSEQQQAGISPAFTFTVNENESGASIRVFNVADPDVDQTHTFSVDDERFEFIGAELKLKDQHSLDYEVAASVPLVVTVIDSGGLSSEMHVRVDVLNVGEPIEQKLVNITPSTDPIPEDTAVGDPVGLQVQAIDPDGDSIRYELVDSAGGLFAIDEKTGEVTAAAPLDYETASSHVVVIRATSDDGSSVENEFNILIGDVDETVQVSAVGDTDAADNSVNENSAVGAAVGITANAVAGPDDTVTYSLIDDADGRFSIDPQTGEIAVAGKLDYESATSHTVRVLATASNGTSSEEDFTIAVSDVDEVVDISAVGDTDAADNSVAENSAVGTAVGITASAVAGSDDTVTYSLTDDADGRFSIDPKTGEIAVAGELDYESASSHTVRVLATASNGTASEDTFTIQVDDTNEAPVLIVSAQGGEAMVETFDNGAAGWSDNTTTEDGEHFGTFLGQFGNGSSVEKTFAIDSGAEKAVIEFDLYEIDSWDDELFRIEIAGQVIEVPLNWTRSDEDASGESGNVTWSLTSQGEGAALGGSDGAFWSSGDQIHKVRIEVNQPDDNLTLRLSDTLNQQVADESWGIDNLSVQALDGAGNPLALSIQEGVSGAVIATLAVEDPDGADEVTYSVEDPRFEVVGNILKLKADQSLDYETESSVTVAVTVTDAGGLADKQTLTINVIDVNETVPVDTVVDTNTADNAVDENSAVGTAVGITASAAAGQGDTVTYSLVDDADGRFSIDPETGEIAVAGELDHESASSHTVRVLATASNGTETEEDFTIAVNDVNEAPTLIVNMEGLRNTGIETFEDDSNMRSWWTDKTITDGGPNFSSFLGRFGAGEVSTALDVVRGADKAVIEFDLYEIDSWDKEDFIIEVAGERIEIPLYLYRDDEGSAGTQGDVSWSLVSQAPGAALGFSAKWNEDQIHKVRLEVKNPGGALIADAPAYFDLLDLTLGSNLDEGIENESWGIDNLSVQSQDGAGNPLTMSIQEGVPGLVIATVNVSDPDATDAVTYSVDDDRFEVVDGVLKLKSDQALNYGLEPSVTVIVTVTDAGGLTDHQTLTFGVMTEEHITGVSPVDEVTDTNTADNAVDENSAVGTAVGITASAAAGQGDTVTYSLIDDADGRFSIDPETGEIAVAGELDHESASSHTVRVLATASNGTETEEDFTITVNDVNEAPVLSVSGFEQTGNSVTTVFENFENGAAGWSNNTTADGGESFGNFLGRFGLQAPNIWSGTATTPDVTEKTFSLTEGTETAVIEFDLYEIDSWDNEDFIIEVAGERIEIPLSLRSDESNAAGRAGDVNWSFTPQGGSADLGFTSAWYVAGTDQIHKVRLEISNPGSEITLKLSSTLDELINNESWGIDNLSIQEVNSAGNPFALSVQEGVTGAVIATLAVQDPEGAGEAVYAVDDPRFEVVDGTLKLKSDQSLDYEAERSVSVTVSVTDAGGLKDQKTLTIGVMDAYEVVPVSPIVDVDATENAVNENSAIGTVVGIIADASAGPGESVSYVLVDDAEGRFAIDSQTGEVTVAGALNYEAQSSHTVRVQATASNGTVEEREFDIAVLDVNEPPVIILDGPMLIEDAADLLSDDSIQLLSESDSSEAVSGVQPWMTEGSSGSSSAKVLNVADLLDDGVSHDLGALLQSPDDSAPDQAEAGGRADNVQSAVQLLDVSVQSQPLETLTDPDILF